MLKLTEHVGIIISILYKQKTRWNSDISRARESTRGLAEKCRTHDH